MNRRTFMYRIALLIGLPVAVAPVVSAQRQKLTFVKLPGGVKRRKGLIPPYPTYPTRMSIKDRKLRHMEIMMKVYGIDPKCPTA